MNTSHLIWTYWSCSFITSRKEWSNLIKLTTCKLLTQNHQKETANTNLSVYIFCFGYHLEIWYNVRFVVIRRQNVHIQCLKEYVMEIDLFCFFLQRKKLSNFLWLDVRVFCCNSGPNITDTTLINLNSDILYSNSRIIFIHSTSSEIVQ